MEERDELYILKDVPNRTHGTLILV